VYSPELEIVPTVALPPVTPLTCQVTAVLAVFCTVAVNCWVPPIATVAEVGEIVTLSELGVGVVDAGPHPAASHALTATPARKRQNATRFMVFGLQPRLAGLMATQGLVQGLRARREV